MAESIEVVVTGLGFCTALGIDPWAAMQRGEVGVVENEELSRLPHKTAAVVDRVDLRPRLKRRKDRKLMARPAQLALSAAGQAIASWTRETDELGLYVGVGREPGDDGESEPALVAAQVGRQLDVQRVAGRCRDLYPPLLPLKTLPNMALAHIAIHLDVRGENGTWSGDAAAGLTALRAGIWSVRENRCNGALIVASDSWVSTGAVRDILRMSGGEPISPPGEAGVAILIESASSAAARGAPVLATVNTDAGHARRAAEGEHHAALGRCNAADGLLSVALAIVGRASERWVSAQEPGQPPVGVRVHVSSTNACYAPASGGDLNG
jgi:3-oxoacyl-(acyl-carrier-protein) synthase